MLPVTHGNDYRGCRSAGTFVAAYTTLLPFLAGMSRLAHLASALVLVASSAPMRLAAVRDDLDALARRTFWYSIWYYSRCSRRCS